MSGKPKPDPIAEHFDEALSMVKAASAEMKRAQKSHAARISEIRDWQSLGAEVDRYLADLDSAIVASAKGKPSSKRASAAGKRSGEARREKSDHATLKEEYTALRRDGLDRADAMMEIFERGWLLKLPLTKSQIYKITGFAEADFLASKK